MHYLSYEPSSAAGYYAHPLVVSPQQYPTFLETRNTSAASAAKLDPKGKIACLEFVKRWEFNTVDTPHPMRTIYPPRDGRRSGNALGHVESQSFG